MNPGRRWILDRAVDELRALTPTTGYVVNLGIGLPTALAGCVPPELPIVLHSENGMLGVGPPPFDGDEDPDLVNAGKETVSELPISSYFDSATSFAMIRGGHLALSFLGALQVSAGGDLANWSVPGRMLKGMGGAMDLVAGARRVVVLMEHCTKDGAPRLVETCGLPLTGAGVVHRVITERCVVDLGPAGFEVVELAPGQTPAALRAATGAALCFAPGVGG
jgi:3-oxoacid CoA-transferase subunit B